MVKQKAIPKNLLNIVVDILLIELCANCTCLIDTNIYIELLKNRKLYLSQTDVNQF